MPVDESKVVLKGRLGPGMMITVDLPGGQVCTAVFSYFTFVQSTLSSNGC